VDALIREAMLVNCGALRRVAEPVRRLYVTREISGLLDGSDLSVPFPRPIADVLVGRFLAGYLISVALSYDRNRPPDLERLEGLDEVWALCIRPPRPGWRLFGRFIARDTFIGLTVHNRCDLGSRNRYSERAIEAIDRWEEILPMTAPHAGTSVSDYVTGVVRDVSAGSQTDS